MYMKNGPLGNVSASINGVIIKNKSRLCGIKPCGTLLDSNYAVKCDAAAASVGDMEESI